MLHVSRVAAGGVPLRRQHRRPCRTRPAEQHQAPPRVAVAAVVTVVVIGCWCRGRSTRSWHTRLQCGHHMTHHPCHTSLSIGLRGLNPMAALRMREVELCVLTGVSCSHHVVGLGRLKVSESYHSDFRSMRVQRRRSTDG